MRCRAHPSVSTFVERTRKTKSKKATPGSQGRGEYADDQDTEPESGEKEREDGQSLPEGERARSGISGGAVVACHCAIRDKGKGFGNGGNAGKGGLSE